MDDFARTARIATLNDGLRRSPGPGWILSPGVADLGPEFALVAVEAVGSFERFASQGDPSGERAFCALLVLGRWVSWTIEYLRPDEAGVSPDPADDKLTRRVITVTLASEPANVRPPIDGKRYRDSSVTASSLLPSGSRTKAP